MSGLWSTDPRLLYLGLILCDIPEYSSAVPPSKKGVSSRTPSGPRAISQIPTCLRYRSTNRSSQGLWLYCHHQCVHQIKPNVRLLLKYFASDARYLVRGVVLGHSSPPSSTPMSLNSLRTRISVSMYYSNSLRIKKHGFPQRRLKKIRSCGSCTAHFHPISQYTMWENVW